MNTSADLTDEEINRICADLKVGGAKVRFLRGLGLHVATKPNGRPLMARANWDMVMGKVPMSLQPEADKGPEPDFEALRKALENRKPPWGKGRR